MDNVNIFKNTENVDQLYFLVENEFHEFAEPINTEQVNVNIFKNTENIDQLDFLVENEFHEFAEPINTEQVNELNGFEEEEEEEKLKKYYKDNKIVCKEVYSDETQTKLISRTFYNTQTNQPAYSEIFETDFSINTGFVSKIQDTNGNDIGYRYYSNNKEHYNGNYFTIVKNPEFQHDCYKPKYLVANNCGGETNGKECSQLMINLSHNQFKDKQWYEIGGNSILDYGFISSLQEQYKNHNSIEILNININNQNTIPLIIFSIQQELSKDKISIIPIQYDRHATLLLFNPAEQKFHLFDSSGALYNKESDIKLEEKEIELKFIEEQIKHKNLVESYQHKNLVESYQHKNLVESYQHKNLVESYQHKINVIDIEINKPYKKLRGTTTPIMEQSNKLTGQASVIKPLPQQLKSIDVKIQLNQSYKEQTKQLEQKRIDAINKSRKDRSTELHKNREEIAGILKQLRNSPYNTEETIENLEQNKSEIERQIKVATEQDKRMKDVFGDDYKNLINLESFQTNNIQNNKCCTQWCNSFMKATLENTEHKQYNNNFFKENIDFSFNKDQNLNEIQKKIFEYMSNIFYINDNENDVIYPYIKFADVNCISKNKFEEKDYNSYIIQQTFSNKINDYNKLCNVQTKKLKSLLHCINNDNDKQSFKNIWEQEFEDFNYKKENEFEYIKNISTKIKSIQQKPDYENSEEYKTFGEELKEKFNELDNNLKTVKEVIESKVKNLLTNNKLKQVLTNNNELKNKLQNLSIDCDIGELLDNILGNQQSQSNSTKIQEPTQKSHSLTQTLKQCHSTCVENIEKVEHFISSFNEPKKETVKAQPVQQQTSIQQSIQQPQKVAQQPQIPKQIQQSAKFEDVVKSPEISNAVAGLIGCFALSSNASGIQNTNSHLKDSKQYTIDTNSRV